MQFRGIAQAESLASSGPSYGLVRDVDLTAPVRVAGSVPPARVPG